MREDELASMSPAEHLRESMVQLEEFNVEACEKLNLTVEREYEEWRRAVKKKRFKVKLHLMNTLLCGLMAFLAFYMFAFHMFY